MKSDKFKTTIGLEIHVQLKTRTKMFCRCDNDSTETEPNSNVCPICLGMPGTLPATNQKAVDWTVKTGLALDCSINKESKFDRKHYFYPDLPKGFQISQYDQPIAKQGYLMVGEKKIGINRVHLEEDAGKLLHPAGAKESLLDLNRAGTPLMEIVTEPDLTSPEQAKQFLRLLKQTVIYLGVSDANMEEGQLRCDANISVQKGEKTTHIVEVKNMNSFRAVFDALTYEQKRLTDEFSKYSKQKSKETRGWLPGKKETKPQRAKEEAADYRYFPEPDIPPMQFSDKEIKSTKEDLPKLPSEIKKEFSEDGLSEDDFWSIIKTPSLYHYYQEIIDKGGSKKEAVNWLANEEVSLEIKPEYFVDFIDLRQNDKLPGPMAKKVLQVMNKEGKSPQKIIEDYNLTAQTGDQLEKIIGEIIDNNRDVVKQYLAGKENALQFLIGQLMKETRGQADPEEAKKIFEEKMK
jgi:aspartyl-tRNA(Asn)/glutamyl-tRNA(Gln) amidotransferase subunit B